MLLISLIKVSMPHSHQLKMWSARLVSRPDMYQDLHLAFHKFVSDVAYLQSYTLDAPPAIGVP